ncbi:uncharacterized oxidoreductase Tda5p [Diutina catenulata]
MLSIDDVIRGAWLLKLPVLVALVGYSYYQPSLVANGASIACAAVIGFFYLNEAFKTAGGKWRPISSEDVVVVTGGSRGLGAELVTEFLARGCEVYSLDIVESNNSGAKYMKCDVSQEMELQMTIEHIMRELNKRGKTVTVLINNAGIRHHESVLGMPEEKMEKIFRVNVFSQIWLTKAMVENAKLNSATRLSVCNISSVLGILAPSNLGVYSATKAATTQLHEANVIENAEHRSWMRWLLVLPGQMDTQMFRDVEPTLTAFAPVVGSKSLARKIVAKISRGETGVLCDPLYGNVLPIVKVLPAYLQYWCRKITNMDNKVSQ